MDRVIIYGLGKKFQENREVIEKAYDIVGFSDRSFEKLEKFGIKGIAVHDINEADFDYVLVMSANVSIAYELQKDTGLPIEKIKLYLPYLKERSLLGAYYAEDMEDLLVDRIFADKSGDYSGITYIDIGVCGPIEGDNTYYFYRRGARGILVEADSQLINQIKRARPGDTVINKAVYKYGGQEVTFFRCPKALALSSLREEHIEAWKDELQVDKEKDQEKITVNTVSINELFEMLGKQCDILSIDIEGYDYEALKSLDYSKWRPKVIIVEMLDSLGDRETNEKIMELLTGKGYSLYVKTRPNGIFVDENVIRGNK